MDEELIREAELGDEARKFIESSIGKAMLDRADELLIQAQEALETVDPTNTEKVRSLQNQAQMARNFGEWLNHLVDKGDNALIQWRQSNAES
jgi:hypothetical protein